MTTIPNLPTDSLYKFIAIAGITMALFSTYFIEKSVNELTDDMNALYIEITILVSDMEEVDLKIVEKIKPLIPFSFQSDY